MNIKIQGDSQKKCLRISKKYAYNKNYVYTNTRCATRV